MSNIGVIKIEESKDAGVVYDISLDGTFVNALGGNVVSNTDGFNFQLPNKHRYTDERPYISDGGGRNSVKGKAYTGVDADVAEFEDLYFNKPWNDGVMKMGLGVDEYCDACIQFSRKNYADLMPDGKIKFVGNTIKSRKMSGYLETFINASLKLLLHGDGKRFLDNYYDYIDRIYNYQIPVKAIASKGNIKKTIEDYKRDCNTLTKSGTKKSRQAWYELVIREGKKVNVSDTILYINTGKRKADSDVKRVTHQYIHDDDGNEVELVGKLKTKLLKDAIDSGYQNEDGVEITTIKDLKTKDKKAIFAKSIVREEDEIILNCQLIPQYILDDEERDYMCSEVEGLEYNVEKYIDQFNNRVKPLLVCFSRDIRDSILIKNPDDRKYFTEEDAKMIAGEPDEEGDQDTYEALMTPERKEIEFWLRVGKVPPFVKECKIDWEGLVDNYKKEIEEEKNQEFQMEDKKYLQALEELTQEEVDNFNEEGELPHSIESMMTLGSDMHLYFKRIPDKKPSTGGYIFDDIQVQRHEIDDFEERI